MLVSASLEYSYQKLTSLELDPLTVADFEIIEQNSDYIEEQLLNQVGVFHANQMFLLFLGEQGTQTVRLMTKISSSETSSCFFLTESSELHIAAKTRVRTKENNQQDQS